MTTTQGPSTSLTGKLFDELSSPHRPPCLSLYQPTHRRAPENAQDPVRFRNLVKELEALLRPKFPAVEVRRLLEPFEALADDRDFWNHTLEGLAVLGGPDVFRALRLARPVSELVAVADTFYTRPLRRHLQSVDRYQVLGLSLHKVRLFEGDRDVLDEVDLAPGVPRTIEEALGAVLTEPHRTVASYGGVGQGSTPMHHGHGGRKDEADLDARRFFRAVDRAVMEHHSHPSGLPLILAALPEHHHLFHEVSQNPLLTATGIQLNPDAISIEELRVQASQAIEPRCRERLTAVAEAFVQARSRGLGSDDLAQVARAASSGQVATLMIEAERQVAGRIQTATGQVDVDDSSGPQVNDVLDDLAQLVERKGGQVLALPAEQMPSRTGVAAIYRY
ncbi:MAG: hypothetical protein IT371_07450 [Deltaproteobacteria bacterium]|nr:hypothetical protein [Deltaproteobacteria bacterium]